MRREVAGVLSPDLLGPAEEALWSPPDLGAVMRRHMLIFRVPCTRICGPGVDRDAFAITEDFDHFVRVADLQFALDEVVRDAEVGPPEFDVAIEAHLGCLAPDELKGGGGRSLKVDLLSSSKRWSRDLPT